MDNIKLTSFSHDGGDFRPAPGVLADILAQAPAGSIPKELLAGLAAGDDVAVFPLNDKQTLLATTVFCTPITDDAADFGRIAATQALSKIHAMGGTPSAALVVVGLPADKLRPELGDRIVEGATGVCKAARVAIAGKHAIDAAQPFCGLVVTGEAHPTRLRRSAAAQVGDVIVLGKPLGVGVLAEALKKQKIDEASYTEMLRHTTQLNSVGTEIARIDGVHAITDVTGLGLAGRLLELCRDAGLSAHVEYVQVPVIEAAETQAKSGVASPASARHWDAQGAQVELAAYIEPWHRALLTDPQTSGGLLVTCSPQAAVSVLMKFQAAGFTEAAAIGRMRAGEARLKVA